MKRLSILAAAILFPVLGCSPQNARGTEAEVERWEKEGWSYLESVGERSNAAAYVSHLSSETASTLTAFGLGADGQRIEKRFAQASRKYLIVTMKQTGESGTFSLVFTR